MIYYFFNFAYRFLAFTENKLGISGPFLYKYKLIQYIHMYTHELLLNNK